MTACHRAAGVPDDHRPMPGRQEDVRCERAGVQAFALQRVGRPGLQKLVLTMLRHTTCFYNRLLLNLDDLLVSALMWHQSSDEQSDPLSLFVGTPCADCTQAAACGFGVSTSLVAPAAG